MSHAARAPVAAPPMSRGSKFFVEVSRNANAIPGSTACEITSPISERLRRKVKVPIKADMPEMSILPKSTVNKAGESNMLSNGFTCAFWEEAVLSSGRPIG